MRALIDIDPCVYAAGFGSETRVWVAWDTREALVVEDSTDKKYLKEKYPDFELTSYAIPDPEGIARSNTDAVVERILEGLGKHVKVDSYQLYLTGKGNFRESVATIQPYKGNRTAPRPYHFDLIREHLVEHWGAEVVEGMEADDKVAMEAEESVWHGPFADVDDLLESLENGSSHPKTYRSVIVSIDKDLDQVPGWHYSWQTHNKEERFWFQSEEDALHAFWMQVLVGDTGDNIPGLPSIGKMRAEKILAGCETEDEYIEACREAYLKKGFDIDRMNEVCELLYLLRHPEDKWKRIE